jgi:Flp pilus assembly protein TadB
MSGTEDDRARRRRQQAETAGSLAPRTLLRAVMPSKTTPRQGRPVSRAEKAALVFSQTLMIVLVLAVAYLLATRVSLILGVAVVAYLVLLYVWLFVLMARRRRS